MKTLYVTDLDGTLLNTRAGMSPYSLDVINNLVAKGMPFTYATARSIHSASVVVQGLNLNIPIIAHNGAMIIHPKTKEVLVSVHFDKPQTIKVAEVLNRYHINPLVYSYIEGEEKVSWIVGTENEGTLHYLDKRKGDKRFRPLADEEKLYEGKMYYVTCIGEREELLPAYEFLSRDGSYTCTLQQELYREEYWLEIMPKEATKAQAIQTLKELWGFERVVSFGDAINDIPMFRISDECYAVSNAVEQLKVLATDVIGSNDENGVARWLLENVGEENFNK